jgi:hypothetical protein
MPEKDPVKEMVSTLKSDQCLKTIIREEAEFHIPIWHTGTCEAFLMHMSAALDTIKQQGTFKAYKEAIEANVEQHESVKQAKAALDLLTAPGSKGKKPSKKASAKKSPEKALQKTEEGAASANAPAPELRKEYQANYEKAYFAKETAKNKRKAAATKMFPFYANLLSLDAKYAWTKIVKEQTEADPFKDLQGMSRKGPRGLLPESFDNCVMFHPLTVFPNNAAEQEKYHLSNVFKTSQRVGIHQFVQRVVQLNAYVPQLPCWHYSPSYNTGMMPANVPFTEAHLASHILRIGQHQWQDQYNLQEKVMTLTDMRSLQAFLKAIECVCTPKKAHAQSGEKASHKNKAGSQKSPYSEVLQGLQETWGRAYYAHYQGLLRVQERLNGESQFPRCQEGR